MTFYKALVALVIVGLLALGGAWLLLPSPAKNARTVVLRTDFVGLQVRMTVPSTWSRLLIQASWVYHTGCTDLGVKPIQSVKDPKDMLLAIAPLTPYVPIVGNGFALIPGVEIRKVRPGVDVLVLSDKPNCDDKHAVNAAIDSLR